MTTDVRETSVFISDRLAYLPVRFPTDEDMESYPKVPLTPEGEWKSWDLYDDGQWDDSQENASFGVNVSGASYTQSGDVFDSILSAPKHKAPRVTFKMTWPSPRVLLTMNSSSIY